MYLTNENISFVKKNESLFVSMKHIDASGQLDQVDFAAVNILADSNNHGFEINNHTCLLPISAKGFNDPFRALPTTSFLCTNIVDKFNFRKHASKLVYDLPVNVVANFEVELKFWIKEPKKQELWKCDPFDAFSNLRSDILKTLEDINIKTTTHAPGGECCECVIGFKGEDIIDLADNYILAKYVIANIAFNYGLGVSFDKDLDNLKIILLCNKNDGKSFLENFSVNNKAILPNRINNIGAKSITKQKLFNDDCKLQINLKTHDGFIPYINFAFIMLYFSENELAMQRLEEAGSVLLPQ